MRLDQPDTAGTVRVGIGIQEEGKQSLLSRLVRETEEAARKLGPFGERFGYPCVRLDVDGWQGDAERAIEALARLDAAGTEAVLQNARQEARMNFEEGGRGTAMRHVPPHLMPQGMDRRDSVDMH